MSQKVPIVCCKMTFQQFLELFIDFCRESKKRKTILNIRSPFGNLVAPLTNETGFCSLALVALLTLYNVQKPFIEFTSCYILNHSPLFIEWKSIPLQM